MNNQNQQHYIIHQHKLSDGAMIAIDVLGWEAADENLEVEAYLAEKDGSEKFEARFWRFYQPAMKVVADNLEEVFHAGNGYGRFADQVEKIGRAHSCSVGDIVQLGGLFWMVDGCGFSEVSSLVVKGKAIVEIQAECDRILEQAA
jgi:hypothetical protein